MKRPLLMGILNVTPDSFSDGGRFLEPDLAIRQGRLMIEQGADLVDVGGESTRPGAEPVPEAVELARVIPVVRGLCQEGVRVSIDTSKPAVAQAALAAGADVINDVTGGRSPVMLALAAESGCTICLMHMLGDPQTMQTDPVYKDVVGEVGDYLKSQAEAAQAAGVASDKIWIDPGIGFGKTTEQNLELIRRLERFVETGFPVLIGVSRKSFIGRVLGGEESPAPVEERLEGTLALQALAQASGAGVIRAHDVAESKRVIELTSAVSGS
jgi:dihydropteroate synthase